MYERSRSCGSRNLESDSVFVMSSVNALAVFSVVVVNDEKKISTCIFCSAIVIFSSEDFFFLRPPTILRGALLRGVFARRGTFSLASFAESSTGDAGIGESDTFTLGMRRWSMVRKIMRTAKVEKRMGIRYSRHRSCNAAKSGCVLAVFWPFDRYLYTNEIQWPLRRHRPRVESHIGGTCLAGFNPFSVMEGFEVRGSRGIFSGSALGI